MIFLSILILIVAIALPSISQNIRSILYVRISSIIFIYAGALAFNAFYIQSIGSGIGIYSGLFQVTTISQLLDVIYTINNSFSSLINNNIYDGIFTMQILSFLTLDLLLYITTLIVSILIIFISNKGYFSDKFQRFCNSPGKFLSLLVIISGLILVFLNALLIIITYFFTDLNFDIIMMVNDTSSSVNNHTSQDPTLNLKRWWPSGTTQSWACLAAAVGAYRFTPGSPRVRATVAMASLGVTVPMSVFSQIIENPNGFNKLMYSVSEWKRTGKWPLIPDNRIIADRDLNPIFNKASEEAEKQLSNQGNKFLGDDSGSSIYQFITDQLNSFLLNITHSVPVEGFLDDLIGQQLIIYILLLIVVISTIILFIVYLVIHFMIYNKDYLVNKFNNKFIILFIRYQLFLGKLSSFILPLFILCGLFQLLFGLHFLLTHSIPYESLGIDLHTYISNK
uniref:Uncharacterized protein n=1 Tax=Ganoderma calidophilum TaxID=2026244 RepID=A0A2S1WBP9_9APHY|nr:hypothetical protein [Ganoderma calidophilum]AWJ64005.1 hypothetical protein [Ganoderma calidophilum]